MGDDFSYGQINEYSAHVVFDESLAETQRVSNETTARQSISVTVTSQRLRAGLYFVFLLLGIFLVKAVYLQIIQGDEYRLLAEGNRVRVNLVPSLRGVIYDRNHILLSENGSSFRLTAIPDLISKDSEEQVNFLTEISDLTGSSIAEMLSRLAEGIAHPEEQIVIAENIAYEGALAFILQSEKFPGVAIEASTTRDYITTKIPSLSHVLGYTGGLSAEEYQSLRKNG